MWLILALPVVSMILGTILRWFVPARFGGGSESRLVAYITIAAIGAAWVLSVLTFAFMFLSPSGVSYEVWFGWLDGGVPEGLYVSSDKLWDPVIRFGFGAMTDPLTATMVLTVSSVSLLVQIYSLRYMKGDKGYSRYFIYMSLFTASMLGLSISRNLLQMFVFWELVGVSSYFLIGFWTSRPAAAAAAKKAFLMTRLGDFGFLLALMYLYASTRSLSYDVLDLPSLYAALQSGDGGSAAAAGGAIIASSTATLASLGFFAAAVGKSAQFPLHNWLPDAMEGPTPVSALIHSATMVAAGVFLVARLFPLFQASDIMPLVALIGAFTALFAATMALVSNDIKRVLAFSTMSQLGYMMLALGIGAYSAAIFHLFTHAFFKAGLFLVAGSVNHASGTFNMRYMGGLRKVMPVTYLGAIACSLSLAGFFPLSGFWSKDEILTFASETGGLVATVALILGLITSGFTAFYMFRAIFMTFHGKYKGGAQKEIEDLNAKGDPVPADLHSSHLGESPRIMTMPIIFLSVLALGLGFFINPVGFSIGPIDKHQFSSFIAEGNVSGTAGIDDIEHFLDRALPITYSNERPLNLEKPLYDFSGIFPDREAAVRAGSEPPFILFPALGMSLILAILGVGGAYLLHVRLRGGLSPPATWVWLQNILVRRYYMDELYEDHMVRRAFYDRLARWTAWVDISFIDNVNAWLAKTTITAGKVVTQLQNGQLQAYSLLMAGGVALIVIIYLVVG